MIDDLWVGDSFVAAVAIENRDRHAPRSLAGDAPVRAALEHIAHAAFAPGRVPIDLRDFVESTLTQTAAIDSFVHRNKPLRRRPEYDRILTPPAMRITVIVFFDAEQGSTFAEEFNDLGVRLKDAQASEVLDLSDEFARRIDRSVNFKPIFLTNRKVIRTVSGSRVNTTGARFSGRLTLVSGVQLDLRVSLA